jgi:hypothetical protein
MASKASAYSSSADTAVKQPAPQTEFSFITDACGALSVPRKNFGLPEAAAFKSAWRCSSRLSTGKQ